MEKRQHTVDATGKTLGRLASEVAMLLMGKRSADYRPNVSPSDKVLVTNLSKARFTGTKLTSKLYWRFSGYPGGVKKRTLKEFFEQDPDDLFQKIVSGMLPKNKLRPLMLKHLKMTV